MSGAIVAGVVAMIALGLAAGASYRCGRRQRGALLPVDLVEELSTHKLGCLGESPARVALEIELLLEAGHVPSVRERGAPRSWRLVGWQRRSPRAPRRPEAPHRA
jgi:hypothetical protein